MAETKNALASGCNSSGTLMIAKSSFKFPPLIGRGSGEVRAVRLKCTGGLSIISQPFLVTCIASPVESPIST